MKANLWRVAILLSLLALLLLSTVAISVLAYRCVVYNSKVEQVSAELEDSRFAITSYRTQLELSNIYSFDLSPKESAAKDPEAGCTLVDLYFQSPQDTPVHFGTLYIQYLQPRPALCIGNCYKITESGADNKLLIQYFDASV